MEILDARLDREWLCLKTQPSEALKWLVSFKPSNYAITKEKKKRSLNANSLAWKMMTELGNAIGEPPESVYRYQLAFIPGVRDSLTIKREALESFERAFCRDHIGRKVEVTGEHGELVDVLVTYGSSDYDTKQMSLLIDNILQDCKTVGVITPDDEYIAGLIKDWEAHNEK